MGSKPPMPESQTPYNPDTAHPTFEEDLLESQASVHLAARWLRGRGHRVALPPVKVRPDSSERHAYRDGADLRVEMPVEVKRRGFAFDGPDSYPYDSVFVDEVYKWEAADPKPLFYLVLDQRMISCAVVPRETRPSWSVETRRDKGRERDFYTCPKGECIFERVPEEVRL